MIHDDFGVLLLLIVIKSEKITGSVLCYEMDLKRGTFPNQAAAKHGELDTTTESSDLLVCICKLEQELAPLCDDN
jgi:hypothetical protein